MYDLFLFGCFLGLLAVGMAVFVPILYIIYKLTGGKRKFVSWFKAMKQYF